MSVTTLAFAPVPGGPELLILLLIFVVVFGIPLLALAALAWHLTNRDEGDGRARAGEPARGNAVDEELRRRLEDLERRVETLEAETRDE